MPAERPPLTDWMRRDAPARQAQLRPSAMAVNDLTLARALTYRDLDLAIAQTASWLSRTAPAGARIAHLARNSLAHVLLFYGCARAGHIYQPLNWRLAGAELAGMVTDAEAAVLLHDPEFAEAARQADGAAAREITGEAFLALIGAEAPAPARTIDADAPVLLLYTSGTTGRPKGAIWTHQTVYASAYNFTQVGELGTHAAMLCDTPFFHVVGLLATLAASMQAGGRVHFGDRFTPQDTLARIADPTLGVTHYFCVPQMIQTLRSAPGYDAAATLAKLRALLSGGAPMPAPLAEALHAEGVCLSNGYGMTEAGTLLGMPLDRAIQKAKIGSCGVAAPMASIRIVDKDGRDVAPGEAGEIWVGGPTVTPGYWNNPEATRAAFSADGWFKSGDAARVDEDGYFTIVDRWKDMYISGGENVYPAEVEAALLAMPGIADAGVVGVSDDKWGEVGAAFIVRASDGALDDGAVRAHCDAMLARYKRPHHVRFVAQLPRTASGKIQKQELRRLFAG